MNTTEIVLGALDFQDHASGKQTGRIEIARSIPQNIVFLRMWSVGQPSTQVAVTQGQAEQIGEALLKAAQRPMRRVTA